MTHALWIPVVAVAAIASAGTACAQADMGLRRMQEAQAERERALVPMTPLAPLAPERLQPATQRDDFRPPGRLSVEERRQLRRDIDEAGRELYRRHPHHSQR